MENIRKEDFGIAKIYIWIDLIERNEFNVWIIT